MSDLMPTNNDPAPEDAEAPGDATTAETVRPLVPAIQPPVEMPTAEPLPTETVPGANGDLSFEVEVDVAKQVCYALAHNKKPIVGSLRVHSGSGDVSGGTSQILNIAVASAWAREGRPPIHPVEFSIEAPALGQTMELSPVDNIRLDDIAIADLEDLVPAEITITVTDAGGRQRIIRNEIEIFARTQWLVDPRWAVITAAFVQPNHPVVPEILTAASNRLKKAGLDWGISGYQRAKEGQHHNIAEAIFDELQSRISNYVNPPAIYTTLGQKVRPLDQLLEEKSGTCIDLACALASCYEAAGLHPVIVMITGHAFAGYLTEDKHLNDLYVDTWPAIQNILDSGLLIPVETVTLGSDASFEEAIAVGRTNFDPDETEGILDVARAHHEGVRPLPAQMRRGDELVIVIDNGPSEPPLVERRNAVTRKLLVDSVPARVQRWKNALLDLSFRNRLLNLKFERSGLRLIPPLGSLGRIEDQLNDGKTLIVRAADDINQILQETIAEGKERVIQNAAPALLEQMLHNSNVLFTDSIDSRFRRHVSRLRADARLIEEESGANNLFLTLGSVKWADLYGDYVSPVFLVPLRVKMARGARSLEIQMDDSQSTFPNYCLIEALRAKEQMTLQWFSDDMADDAGLDIEAGLQRLRDEFMERGLDRRGFTVQQTAGIAILDFKKFRLWRDLNDHWQEFMRTPVVRHLVETPRVAFVDPASDADITLDDTSLLAPQPADGSQLKAIARAMSGQSFVLEGPPGTGKSQTITNLLANAMYLGKRVLFVAEKQAALSVVHERLEEVGLGPYCLELHDRGTKPAQVRKQLKDALDQSPVFDELQLEHLEEQFAGAAGHLNRYHRGLYTDNEPGISYSYAFTELMRHGAGQVAPVPLAYLDNDVATVAGVRRRLVELDPFLDAAQVAPRHAWLLAGSASFENIDRARLAELISTSAALADELSAATGATGDLINSATTMGELAAVSKLVDVRERGITISAVDWAGIGGEEWRLAAAAATSAMADAIATATQICPDQPAVIERGDLVAVSAAVAVAAGSFVVGRNGRIRAALGDLGMLLGAVATDRVALPMAVAALAEASDTMRDNLAILGGLCCGTITTTTIPTSPEQVIAIDAEANLLAEAAAIVRQTTPIGETARSMLAQGDLPIPGLGAKALQLSRDLQALGSLLAATEESIRAWAGDGIVGTMTDTGNAVWRRAAETGTYVTLQRWIDLQKELDHLRHLGLDHFCHLLETKQISSMDAAAAYDRGVLTATLEVRAEELQFDIFNRDSHDQRVQQFTRLLGERQLLAIDAIPFGLYRSRRVQAGVSTGKVGDFRHEVSSNKKVKGRSIRRLIEEYPDIITDLTPCFLMSPDSVAQFLPAGAIEFDLVVFDEASQITVADAIGALGRARAVVIVGDSRQMPPTRFGVASARTKQEMSMR